MKVTEPISIGTNNEGKKIFIKRPCKKFADIAAYQEAFAAEATQGMGWAHPNLLIILVCKRMSKGGTSLLNTHRSSPSTEHC